MSPLLVRVRSIFPICSAALLAAVSIAGCGSSEDGGSSSSSDGGTASGGDQGTGGKAATGGKASTGGKGSGGKGTGGKGTGGETEECKALGELCDTTCCSGAVCEEGSCVPKGSPAVGAGCGSDIDCGGGTCILPTDDNSVFGGGPAGGYCSLSCEKDADCGTLGTCALSDGGNWCVQSCTPKLYPIQYLNDPLQEDLCFARENVACDTVDDVSFCKPTCGTDAECGSRKCDPKLGVCVDTPRSGKVTGELCDHTQALDDGCAGTCAETADNRDSCTTGCVKGGAVYGANDCGGHPELCVWSGAGVGAGDAAYCAATCTEHDDCQAPGFMCAALKLEYAELIGFCTFTQMCESDNDCASQPSRPNCLTTSVGKLCGSNQFPLGTLTP